MFYCLKTYRIQQTTSYNSHTQPYHISRKQLTARFKINEHFSVFLSAHVIVFTELTRARSRVRGLAKCEHAVMAAKRRETRLVTFYLGALVWFKICCKCLYKRECEQLLAQRPNRTNLRVSITYV